MKTLLRPAGVRRRALAAMAVLTALAAPAAARAAPVTYSQGGASVTFDSGRVVAERGTTQRVRFTATGFQGLRPGPGAGMPVLALKWDDEDTFVDWGGPTRWVIEDEPKVAAFQVGADGTVAGWVDLPATIAKVGPGAGAHAGEHQIRVLSGAFSTAGVNLAGDKNVTVPITFRAWIRATDPVEVGFTNTAGTFYPGTVLPATPGVITVHGIGFDPNEPVAATLDGATLAPKTAGSNPPVDATTDGAGAFSATITLPPGAAGDRTLGLATGTVNRAVTVKRIAHGATLDTTQPVRPGGTVVVKATGFVGIGGAGQKVGVVLQPGDRLVGCAQADATGAARIAAAIPSDAALGRHTLLVLGGTACAPPLVTDPMGRLTGFADTPNGPQNALSITPDAPTLASPFEQVSIGGAAPVTASGFAPGESVAVEWDGAPRGAPLTATADGTLSASLAVPAGSSPGEHVVVLRSASVAVGKAFRVVPAATVTITSGSSVQAGERVTFDLRGFARGDATAGQKVGVKIDAGAIVECVQASVAGDGSGSILIPAETTPGEHTLRFLAGSSCVSGAQNDLPSRSLAAPVTVRAVSVAPSPTVEQGGGAPPAPTPTRVPSPTPAPTPRPKPTVLSAAPTPSNAKVTGRGTQLGLTLSAATRVRITVRTAGKVRLTARSEAKVFTVVATASHTPKGSKTRTVTLKLTKDGRSLLRRLRSLKVIVTVRADGRATTTRTLTIKA